MKKKVLVGTAVALLLGAGISLATIHNNFTVAKAEGEEEIVEVVEESEITEEEFMEKVKSWLSQYLDSQMVANIITWASEGGILVALFTVYLKYRRYKATSIEDMIVLFKKEIKSYIEEQFKNLSADEVRKIVNSFNKVEQKMDDVMKALVLAQDKTVDGKLAMLDLIAKSTESAEVKEIVANEKEQIEENRKVTEAVKEAVSDDYVPVE